MCRGGKPPSVRGLRARYPRSRSNSGKPYSTERRVSPFAGSVFPRSSLFPVRSACSAAERVSLPPPASSSAPARMRTMLYKNPFPAKIHVQNGHAEFLPLRDAHRIQRAHRRLRRRTRRGKRREVVFALEEGCAGAHGGKVGHLRHAHWRISRKAGARAAKRTRSSGTFCALPPCTHRTPRGRGRSRAPRTAGGRRVLSASAMRSGETRMLSGKSRLHTCPAACTPASVLPLPVTRACTPNTSASARSSASCTVGAFACTCQPAKPVPS